MYKITHAFENIYINDEIYVSFLELQHLNSIHGLEKFNQSEIETVTNIVLIDYKLYEALNNLSYNIVTHEGYSTPDEGDEQNIQLFDSNWVHQNTNKKFKKIGQATVQSYIQAIKELQAAHNQFNIYNSIHADFKQRTIKIYENKLYTTINSILGNVSDNVDIDIGTLSTTIFPYFLLDANNNTMSGLMQGDVCLVYIFMRSIEFAVNKINTESPTFQLTIDDFLEQILMHLAQVTTSSLHFGHYGSSDNNDEFVYDQNFTKYEVYRRNKRFNLTAQTQLQVEHYTKLLNKLLLYVLPCLQGIKNNVQEHFLPPFYLYVWAFVMCYENRYKELKAFAEMKFLLNDDELLLTNDTLQIPGIGQSFVMLYYTSYSGANFNPDTDSFLQYRFDSTTTILFNQ